MKLHLAVYVAVVAMLSIPGSVEGQATGVGTGAPFYRHQGETSPRPMFDMPFSNGGVSVLSSSLTVNSTTVAATGYYLGANASGSGWTATAGPDLDPEGLTGRSYDLGVPVPDGEAWKSTAATGGYFGGAAVADLDLTDGDFIFEYFGAIGANGTVIANKLGTGNAGYQIFFNNSGQIVFQINDGTGFTTTTSASGGAAGDWAHFIFFFDRSGSARGYANGAGGGVASISGRSGSLTSDIEVHVGANRSGTGALEVPWAIFGFWEQGSWLDTHLQDSFAAERFARLIGTYETLNGAGAPSSFTRASSATLVKYNATTSAHELYTVGLAWPRAGSWNDGSETRSGVQVEITATNIATYTDDFDAAGWSLSNASASGLSSSVYSPDPEKLAFELIPNLSATSANVNNASTAPTLTNTSGYVVSVFAEKGTLSGTDWLQIEMLGTAAPASADQYYDLTNGVTGTAGAGVDDSGIVDFGGGWYLCWLAFTADANDTAYMNLFAAEADGDRAITGDGSSPSTHLFGAQFEEDAHPSSYIASGSAATARSNEAPPGWTLSSSSSAPLTIVTNAFRDKGGLSASTSLVYIDDTGTSDVHSIEGESTTNNYRFYSSRGVDEAVADTPGSWESLTFALDTNDAEVYIDGVSQATDSTVTGFGTFDRIYVGGQTFNFVFGGFVGRTRIYGSRLTDAQVAVLP